MTALFASIGEVLIDFTPVVEDGRAVGFRMHLGGSPCNVAVALARLGAAVEFVAKASTDLFGNFMIDQLHREGVGVRWLTRARAPSTLAFVALEGKEPSYAFYGAGAADTLLESADLPAQVATSMVLHFGSISLLQNPTSRTIIGLVEKLRGKVLLSFDPNIRPSLVRDEPAYRRTLGQMCAAADIVKLSATDAGWWAPKRALPKLAADILSRGPALVVITQGADGAYARTARVEAQAPAPAVRVVDTVGAGDAFTAALLFTLIEHRVTSRATAETIDARSLQAALQVAASAGALTCTRAGADPPRRDELDAFLTRGRESGRRLS
ncbi:MAG TPA: carbohydrate kinase [bacterium]|nr:carbohydrate kinase [bacterium]